MIILALCIMDLSRWYNNLKRWGGIGVTDTIKKVMICKRCGKLVNDGSKYCNYCGNIISSNQSMQQNKVIKGSLFSNKIVLATAGIVLTVLVVFMAIKLIGSDDILMQGVEFGMSKSEVASKVKLDNLYNEDNDYLGYAASKALTIDERNISAEVQFSFNGNDELYRIEYQFEGGGDVDTEIVAEYLNDKYSGQDFTTYNGKTMGKKESGDYYLTMKGDSLILESKKYE